MYINAALRHYPCWLKSWSRLICCSVFSFCLVLLLFRYISAYEFAVSQATLLDRCSTYYNKRWEFCKLVTKLVFNNCWRFCWCAVRIVSLSIRVLPAYELKILASFYIFLLNYRIFLSAGNEVSIILAAKMLSICLLSLAKRLQLCFQLHSDCFQMFLFENKNVAIILVRKIVDFCCFLCFRVLSSQQKLLLSLWMGMASINVFHLIANILFWGFSRWFPYFPAKFSDLSVLKH